MPNNWKTYTIENIAADIAMGPFGSNIKRENFVESGVPVIRGNNLNYGRFKDYDFVYLTEEKATSLKRSVAYSDELVFTHRGTIGQVGIIPKNSYPRYVVSQSQMRLALNKEKANPLFIFYYFRSQYGQREWLMNSSQVGVPAIAQPTASLKGCKINLPPIEEQKAIASILSALDDKIELNLQTNKTLEEMAMTLYKHWFVDFGPFQNGEFIDSELGKIPKGWEVKSIGDIYQTTSGGTPSRKKLEFYEGGTIPWVKSKELYGTFVIDTEEKITQLGIEKSSAKLIPKKSVLLAMYGATVGETSILSNESTCNQAICAIIQKDISYLYVFHYLRYYKSEILNQAVGSAQQNISQVIIKNFKVVSPPKNLGVFNEIEDYYNTIEQNLIENQTLTTLRDTLLPKLISGEVRIKDVEQTITDHESVRDEINIE
ncbi:MAG: restriction endonuclease subunit S [Bacteroidales bacterium]|nr:restriction endonuclease subunit S [Bacteroidales bacterium]